MYTQVGDFRVSRGPPTFPLTRIHVTQFFQSPKKYVRREPSVEVPSFKPLIFIPDVLKASQEEDVNTNQDLICWFK